MRKKLDTRFPAARIKRIMQADDEVGKIAMAVPLLMSKALELFLQDLCGRTHEVTLERGAKTLNSLHLKQCVRRFSMFDFLKDTVSKVPDLGGSDAAAEDKSATKRRMISEDEDGDEPKRIRMQEKHCTSSNGRGRGGGRGRGRGRGRKALERESIIQHEKSEEDVDSSNKNDENQKKDAPRTDDNVAGDADSRTASGKDEYKYVRDFDLNVELNENGESTLTFEGAHSESSTKTKPIAEVKHEDIPGWSLHDMEKMGIDPVQFASLNGGMYDEDEDYDGEE